MSRVPASFFAENALSKWAVIFRLREEQSIGLQLRQPGCVGGKPAPSRRSFACIIASSVPALTARLWSVSITEKRPTTLVAIHFGNASEAFFKCGRSQPFLAAPIFCAAFFGQ